MTTLEVSKKLEEAGWDKETEKWWVKWTETVEDCWKISLHKHRNMTDYYERFPALSVEELFEEMPDDTTLQKDSFGKYFAYLKVGNRLDEAEGADNPADALALLWIELNSPPPSAKVI